MVFKFFQKYWKEILAVSLFLCYIIKTQYDYASLYKVYIDSINHYDKQISDMQDLHIKHINKKNKIIQDYKKEIEQINKKYAEDSKKISKKTEVIRKRHVDNFTKNPKKLIQDIEKVFGFKHVE